VLQQREIFSNPPVAFNCNCWILNCQYDRCAPPDARCSVNNTPSATNRVNLLKIYPANIIDDAPAGQ
jgi:hypothetical protein